MVVYRFVKTDDRGDSRFLDSFKSRQELGYEPRPGVETEHPAVHGGISVFRDQTVLIQVLQKTRRRGFREGEAVARLELDASLGVSFHEWGTPGHLTLWGEPVKLSQAVTGTVPLWEEAET